MAKESKTGGYSLMEILVATIAMGVLIVTVSTSLIVSFKMNTRSNQILKAQIQVSSTIEKLMATGVSTSDAKVAVLPDSPIEIKVEEPPGVSNPPYYNVTVTYKELKKSDGSELTEEKDMAQISTKIRKKT